MTMQPINRIPLEAESPTLHAIVQGELRNRAVISLSEQLESLFTHDDSEKGLECTLDWAMQIRSELGIDWSSAIDAAMTLFYG